MTASVRTVGLAIFVKTPGHSPLKTRLAATINRDAAHAFHILSASAVAAVACAAQRELPELAPCWAVAEAAALDDPCWASLPRIAQGDGDLGVRMGRVCAALQAKNGSALLLGADAPQVEVADLVAAVNALDTHDHVIGPSGDGGFWLFGTCSQVHPRVWTTTPWSQPDTATHFCTALDDARIARVRTLRDADTADDLLPLLVALDALCNPLPEQAALAEWLRAFGVNAVQTARAAAK